MCFRGCLKIHFRTLELFACTKTKKQQNRENERGENSDAEIVAAGTRYDSCECWSAGASKITGQSEQGKHGSAAAF